MSATFDSMWSASMSTRGFLLLKDDGVRVCGMDTGHTTLIGLHDVPGFGTVATFHEEGGTHWTGRGMKPSYHGAMVWTALVEPHDPADGARRYRYVRLSLIDIPRNATERTERHQHYATYTEGASA